MLPLGRNIGIPSLGRLGSAYLFSSKSCPPKPGPCCPPRKERCVTCTPPKPPPPPPHHSQIKCPPPPPPAPPSNTYCPEPPSKTSIPRAMQVMDPACKLALITGGSSGIGFGIAQQLLCSGVRKAILASNNPREGEAAARALNDEFGCDKAIFYEVDVNCIKQFEALFRETILRFSTIDIFVNSAGIINDRCWDLAIDVNLKATTRGTILAMKYMAKDGICKQGRGGVILNVTGISGMIPFEVSPINCAINHGIVGLTRSFGDPYHYRRTDLRVMGICPGLTTTPQLKNIESKSLSTQMGIDTKKMFKTLPPQRPHEVGKAAVYIMKYGETANCYIIEAGEIFKYIFPCKEASSNFLQSVC